MLAHGKPVAIGTVIVFVVTIGLFMTMGSSFLPDFNEGSATISAVAKPGVSLEVNDKLGKMMEEALLEVPEVTATARAVRGVVNLTSIPKPQTERRLMCSLI